ncbi:MAG: ubiquitin-like small modifier protein 1 [Candidatus Hadarchaeales archaeon]
MEITVKLYGPFKEHAGTESIRVTISEDETVDTLLMKLSRRYPKVVEDVLDPTTGDLRENCNITLNGRRIQQIRGIHTKLKHKDEIALSPPEETTGKSASV